MTRQQHGSPKGRAHQEPLYDTDVPTPTHAERGRTLVASQGTGTLCTATAETGGHPYGSFVTYGLHEGAPVFLVSVMAEHTQNLEGDPRCSLLVAEPGTGDPLARARATLVGTAERLERGADAEVRETFLAAHPNASYYVDFKDFHFWKMEIESVRYIGGYGRMSWVEGASWIEATEDPIAPFATRIIDHMNDDHADTMVLYCRALSRATDAEEVRMTSVDRYGFEMSVKTAQGPRPVRLPFESEVGTAKEVRQALVAMAERARQG
jgi:putative heme iron utilization protein